jgi:hypothetical protein
MGVRLHHHASDGGTARLAPGRRRELRCPARSRIHPAQAVRRAFPVRPERPAHPDEGGMTWVGWLLLLSGNVPLAVAARANRSTSLIQAIAWSWLAWAAWAAAFATGAKWWSYVALVLTGCAGVAVLGARRPGAAAWNFVVLGLLVVLLLPLAEAAVLGTPLHPGTFRTSFLTVLFGMTVVNYLPTRLGAGAALLGIGCGWELLWLNGESRMSADLGGMSAGAWCVGLAPWAAWVGVAVRRSGGNAVDRLWQSFRDRYGLVWGQRLREQFNRAAANAGLGVELSWTGLRSAGGASPDTGPGSPAYETLAALMKRFGLPGAG